MQVVSLFVIPVTGIFADFKIGYTYQCMWSFVLRLLMVICALALFNPMGGTATTVITLVHIATNIEMVIITAMFTKLMPSDLCAGLTGFVESSVSGVQIIYNLIAGQLIITVGPRGPMYLILGADFCMLIICAVAYFKGIESFIKKKIGVKKVE